MTKIVAVMLGISLFAGAASTFVPGAQDTRTDRKVKSKRKHNKKKSDTKTTTQTTM